MFGAVLWLGGPAWADGRAADELPTPSVWAGYETLRLPNGETMGWLGGELLFDGDGDGGWQIGPAVYGAAAGQRGGLFVGGLSLRRRWALGNGWGASAGLFAGAGGGAGAPVGSGLVLRPSLSVLKALGPTLDAGLSWSWVDFSSGDIRSSQVGLTLAWHPEHGQDNGEPPDAAPAAPLGQLQATAGVYTPAGDSGRHLGRHVGLVGARVTPTAGGGRWGIEAETAGSGGAAGYMAIFGTLDLAAPVGVMGPGGRVGLRLGAGLGGGGAVPTGGGLIAKAAFFAQAEPWPGWTLGAAWGQAQGVDGPWHAGLAQAWLGIALGSPRAAAPGDHPSEIEVSMALRHHAQVQRRDGARLGLDTVGLKLDASLGEHLYATGEAHSAYAGRAGAFGIGLVGLGWAGNRDTPGLRTGIELTAGAAGGGGVDAGGGAVVQAMAWASWAGPARGRWRVGLGRLEAARGGLAGNVVELAWTRAWSLSGR